MPWGIDAIDLLPGWYDDWALLERERIRQRLLHALEALSCQLVRAGRFAEAVEAAMMAVTAEPLRESAQRVLIQAHLAEGNWVEGRRTFEAYRDMLEHELGVQPEPELAAMLRRPVTAPEGSRNGASASLCPRICLIRSVRGRRRHVQHACKVTVSGPGTGWR